MWGWCDYILPVQKQQMYHFQVNSSEHHSTCSANSLHRWMRLHASEQSASKECCWRSKEGCLYFSVEPGCTEKQNACYQRCRHSYDHTNKLGYKLQVSSPLKDMKTWFIKLPLLFTLLSELPPSLPLYPVLYKKYFESYP